jgi:hypothetical protein
MPGKTTLKSYTDNNAIEISNNYDVKPNNNGDGSDGSDGSRDSAYDISDNDVMVATAANLQEISPNTEEEGRG